MGRKLQYQQEDDATELIARYQLYLDGKGPGYFDVEELELIVEYFLRRGKTREGNSAIDLGLKLHPGNSTLQAKRAKIYLALGETQKALRILETLTNNSDYELLLLKAEALTKSGRQKEAELLCQQIIENEGDDIDNIALDIAFIFIADLDFERALHFLKQGDKYNNSNTDLLFELAFCYEQLIQTSEAIEVYNRIINIDSFLPEAWFNLGQVYFVLEDYAKALTAYDFVMAINENDSLACLQKAHAHFQLEQYPQAVETYLDYAKMTGENWQTRLFVAESYEKMEDFDTAIKYYQMSLEENKENYDALTGIAICLLEKEQFVESIQYSERALAINETAHDAWVYLAEALIGIDNLEEALLAYLKSISLEPNQPDTLMAIANICMDKGEWKTALEYYLAAYNMDNTLEFIDLFLAISFYKNENMSASKIYLHKAMAQNLDAERLFFEVCPDADKLSFL
jgi:tetratricopeptide (TPR) repeat protein